MRLIDADVLSDSLERMIEMADIKSWEYVREPVVAHHYEMLKKQIEEILTGISGLPTIESAQPEQLEKCPIYGGVCLHPSDQCYECPRHAGAERKKGHWVEIGDEPYDEWECDMCGFVIDGSGCIDPEEYKDVYNFCPNCGADMREGGRDETD